MEQNTDLATLKALTDNGVNKVLQISSAIENVHSLLANGHPTVLAVRFIHTAWIYEKVKKE